MLTEKSLFKNVVVRTQFFHYIYEIKSRIMVMKFCINTHSRPETPFLSLM